MSEALTLITITMPSAPTVAYAPFATQTVYLTTGDDYFRSTDSVTFQGNTIEDISEISNEIDMSQGQGAYNTAMHGTISFADSCDGGRLLPLILNGSIPLIGAAVFIQSEGELRYDPITLYLQNPSADSDGILSFDLYAAQYTRGQKLIKWSASRASELVDVGVVVGNATTDNARYVGVSVPTNALDDPIAITHTSYALSGFTGNPATTSKVIYGEQAAPEGKLPAVDDGVHRTFQYEFPSQATRDVWFKEHYGDPSSLTDFGTLEPYITSIITDGTNVEFILFTSAEGKIYYASNETSLPATILQKGTVAGSSPTIYTVDAICSDNSTLLNSYLDSIKIYELKATNPICAGASHVVGYQSKAGTANEYGIVKPLQLVYDYTAGTLVNKNVIINGILNFVPAFPTSNSAFYSVTEIANATGITYHTYNAASQGNQPLNMAFSHSVNDIATVSTLNSTNPFNVTASQAADSVESAYTFTMTLNLLHNLDSYQTNVAIDKVYFDTAFNVQLTLGSTLHSWHLKWIDPFRSAAQIDLTTRTSASATLVDIPATIPFCRTDHMFDSLAAATSSATAWIAEVIYWATTSFSFTETINNIVAYIGTKLAYGSNPAVVIPSYFPDTTIYTTTPVLAIQRLQTFAGSDTSGIYIGSHTTYPAAWGRYIEPTANVNDTIADITKENWLFVNDAGRTDAIAPTSETLEPVTYKVGNVEDIITEPIINYDFAGGSAQYAAAISHVDEPFTTTNAAGRYWSGWQEKDTIQLGKACLLGGTIVATGVLQDCIACICSNGSLYCSFDGGTSWPVSQSIVAVASSTSTATITCGNGVMLATAMNNSSYSFAYYSTDYGRSWAPITTINGTAVSGGALSGIAISSWYDSVEGALWLGGQSSTGYATIYKTTNGASVTTMYVTVSSANLSGVVQCIAAKQQPSAGVTNIAVGVSGQTALLASAETGAANTWYAKAGVPMSQHIQYFNGAFRIFSGNTMYASINLIDWGTATTTYSFSNSATSVDGKIIVGFVDSANFWYSRDAGNNWALINWMTDEYAGAPGWLWDDQRSCFICPTIVNTTIFSVGDPAVYQLWITCRNAYLAHGVINSSTYDWKSIYNADNVIDMLLVQDGIDGTVEAARINWICKQPRYVEMSVNYSNVATQLSVSSAQRIVIPRQRLQDAGLDNNVPTYGIISSVQHNIKTGVSTLQIAMPPI